MSKKYKIAYWVVFILSCVFSQFYDWKLNSSDIVAFVSIIMGFQITAFSLLFYSNVVQKLYNEKSLNNPNITLKHELKNYYSLSFNTSLITIMLILLVPNDILKQKISFITVCINSYMFYITNSFLYKIFIKESGK